MTDNDGTIEYTTGTHEYFLLDTYYGEGERYVETYSEEGLLALLNQLMADSYYGMDTPDISGIYRYESPGKLIQLELKPNGRAVDANDMVHQTYELIEKGGAGKPMSFTVTTDGRA